MKTQISMTIYSRFSHVSITWHISIQSMHTHTTYWRSVILLSSHLRLDLPSGPFSSGYHTKPCRISILPSISPYPPIPFRLIDHPSIIWWWIPILKLHVVQFYPLACYPVNFRPISWTPYYEDLLFCVPPLMSENDFHVPPKREAKWHFCIFDTL